MASKYKGTDKVGSKKTEVKKTGTIDLDKVAPKLKGHAVKFKVNEVELSAPSQYFGDKTAIAGTIKEGRVHFSRCKPENCGNYQSVETDQGQLHFGGTFVEALKGLVK